MAKKWGIQSDAARLKQTKASFRAIAQIVDPGGERVGSAWDRVRDEVQAGFRMAAQIVRDKARSGAEAVGAPRRLYSGTRPAIFAFSDFDATRDPRRKRSALVGMRTGLASQAKDPSLFVTWGKGAKRRKGGTVATRGLSMSLAALFERGRADKRIKPGRFFRSAIFSTRSTVARLLTNAYVKAVGTINRLK